MSLVRAVDPHHRSPHSSPAKGADPLSGENGPDKHLPARAESLATRSLHPLGQQVGHHRRGRFRQHDRSEEHTSELQSLMRISYAVFCLKKKTKKQHRTDYSSLDITYNKKRHNDT